MNFWWTNSRWVMEHDGASSTSAQRWSWESIGEDIAKEVLSKKLSRDNWAYRVCFWLIIECALHSSSITLSSSILLCSWDSLLSGSRLTPYESNHDILEFCLVCSLAGPLGIVDWIGSPEKLEYHLDGSSWPITLPNECRLAEKITGKGVRVHKRLNYRTTIWRVWLSSLIGFSSVRLQSFTKLEFNRLIS